MKKILIVLTISILATALFACNGTSDTRLDGFFSEMAERNNYTVVIHSTFADSDVYTETVYAFDGANEYERTPESERLYLSDGTDTAIYLRNGESWQQTSVIKNYDATQFLRFLQPFLNGTLYRYDRKADIYVMLDEAYDSLQIQGIANVWCEISDDTVTIFYNHSSGDQKIVTDMQIKLVNATTLPDLI